MNRNELEKLKNRGYVWSNPHDIINIFEKKIAEYCGSKYAVAVDSCSNALFLVLKYINKPQVLTIPKHTYLSIPMQIIHAGYSVKFEEVKWYGNYKINPLEIYDGAGQWGANVFKNGYYLLSFQFKKIIPIGKGGMVLLNNKNAYEWLLRARHDGRCGSVDHKHDDIAMLGWHMNMIPEDAARGIMLFDDNLITGISHSHKSYKDLTKYKIFYDYR